MTILKLARTVVMRATAPITQSGSSHVDPRARRSSAVSPRRCATTRAPHIELPGALWERIVLFMFTCCLFILLDAFVPLHIPLPVFPSWNRSPAASNEDQKPREHGMSRVMVDWHGNYELLPCTATLPLVSPASIPQDASPDPRPSVFGELGHSSLSTATKAKTPGGVSFMLYGHPHDPIHLEFEEAVDGENHGLGLYPPETALQ